MIPKKHCKSNEKAKYSLITDGQLINSIFKLTGAILRAIKSGNRLIFAGNGGCAAVSQQLSVELVGCLEFERPRLPALLLSTDTPMSKAIGNDREYDELFLRRLQAQVLACDLVVGITASGVSSNVLGAFELSKHLQVTSIPLCGLDGELEDKVGCVLLVPSLHSPQIQECRIWIGHMEWAAVNLQMCRYLASVRS